VTVPDEPFDTDPGIDADLAALLAEPALWEPADAGLEDAVVAAIAAESASSGVVVPLTRSRHRLVAAAAAVVLVVLMVGAVLSIRETSAPGGIELALEATELAPAATGVVSIDDTPFGTRLVLAVSGLPPAAADQYYEAWLRTGPEVGVSAGTFHLRGGDGEIELWAGVTAADYPLFTITIQDEADAESSGRVVLKGRVAE
jgi:anti-sigma-K factor RskA